MNEKKETADRPLEIPAEDADRLLACADGKSALLYLHILRTGAFSLSRAARDLRMSENEAALAADSLRRLGLIPGEQLLPAADEMPQYETRDIVVRAKSDPAFEGIIFEAQQALGKLLSTNDMRLLFGIYDHLGLPAEVILLLINHCIEEYRTANGEGRMPTMRYIEKEAWFWANREIITLESAEEHIRREKERALLSEQVKSVLQIRGRPLTPTEEKYIFSWLELGYTPEALAIAYDRTVIGTGRLTWKYMDKIVQAWYEKQLFTPEDIARGDSRPRRGAAVPPGNAGASAAPDGDVERMRRMYAHMKKGR